MGRPTKTEMQLKQLAKDYDTLLKTNQELRHLVEMANKATEKVAANLARRTTQMVALLGLINAVGEETLINKMAGDITVPFKDVYGLTKNILD